MLNRNAMPKCGAKARQANHQPCKQPAMKNGRCRLHGGFSTGPKTPEGKLRSATANFKNGFYTQSAVAERKRLRSMVHEWRNDLNEF